LLYRLSTFFKSLTEDTVKGSCPFLITLFLCLLNITFVWFFRLKIYIASWKHFLTEQIDLMDVSM